jgi:hypothetical protein
LAGNPLGGLPVLFLKPRNTRNIHRALAATSQNNRQAAKGAKFKNHGCFR